MTTICRSAYVPAFFSLILALCVACPQTTEHSDGDGDGDGDGDETPTCKDELDPTKALDEECCPDYELDACAPNLFCAAFDGRSVASCYEDGAREPGESCNAHSNCDPYYGAYCIEASRSCGFSATQSFDYGEYLGESDLEEALNSFVISTYYSSDVAWEGDSGAYVIAGINIDASINDLQACPLAGTTITFGDGDETIAIGTVTQAEGQFASPNDCGFEASGHNLTPLLSTLESGEGLTADGLSMRLEGPPDDWSAWVSDIRVQIFQTNYRFDY